MVKVRMQSCEPAIWTLENSSAMYRHFEGQYPTAKLVQMRDHAALPCERRRIILSNRSLYFPVEPSKRGGIWGQWGSSEELTNGGLMPMGQALGHNRPEEPVRHHRIRQARSAGDSSLLRQFCRSTCSICCIEYSL